MRSKSLWNLCPETIELERFLFHHGFFSLSCSYFFFIFIIFSCDILSSMWPSQKSNAWGLLFFDFQAAKVWARPTSFLWMISMTISIKIRLMIWWDFPQDPVLWQSISRVDWTHDQKSEVTKAQMFSKLTPGVLMRAKPRRCLRFSVTGFSKLLAYTECLHHYVIREELLLEWGYTGLEGIKGQQM